MPGSEPPSQSSISSYFQPTSAPRKTGRRVNSPIDLTAEDKDLYPPSKRPRLLGPDEPMLSSHSAVSSSSSAVDVWRYSPEKQNSQQEGPSVPRSKSDEKRLAAFKKSLLQDNQRFLKKDPREVDLTKEIPAADGGLNANDSGEELEDSFKELTDMFSRPQKHKSGSKGKAAVSTRGTSKKAVELGPSGEPYTPLEKQVLQLKKENAGTVLMIEVGYKYKFFGEDAKIAAKELGMVAHMDRNFVVASIPVHRRDIHVKKLLSSGYRVGIVDQIETAALKKVSDNRNAPFDRRLSRLYTAATYVDGLDSVDESEERSSSVFMCLIEETQTLNNNTSMSIGMISICPSTGDVVWDEFEDTIMRLELETRLVHTQPAELLIAKNNLSPATRKLITHFIGSPGAGTGRGIHIETLPTVLSYPDALERVTEFYSDKNGPSSSSENFKQGKLAAATVDLPKRVIIALAHAIKHLSAFGIADAFAEARFFVKFATRAHMLLAANTLINLEIYHNEDDHTESGSLIWVLDRTKTKFGARLLRNWVGRPLVDKRLLEERVNAVEEILESSSEILLTLRGLLKGLPDLARGLSRIQYGQCTMKELAILLPAFNKVANAFDDLGDCGSGGPFKSGTLNQIIYSLPTLKEPMLYIFQTINLKKLEQEDKTSLWADWERHPEIQDAQMSLQAIEIELETELKTVRKQLRMPSLQWATVAIDDHLVEVKRSEKRPIPDNWILHSRTKFYERYRPPAVVEKLQERAQRRETLESEANKAYRRFLAEISEKYYAVFRNAVTKLATADCLLSLAQVALQKNYTRPQFVDDDSLEIVDGRHPIIEVHSDDPYICNSVKLGGDEASTKIITGPNMGGKSSCVRMIALVALMAQIGSYVPAASVKLGLLDSILTRMGASDDLARGRSTFMVEMSETSEILQTATSRSLVILDELGRGTSTFDGMAIADATLQYLVEKIKAKTLFITHYPLLATKLQSKFPADIQNIHMGYDAESRIDGSKRITFLYKLIPGLATESFGIECARMARVPEKVVSMAAEKAIHMQEEVRERARKNRLRKVPHLIQQLFQHNGIQKDDAMKDLKGIMELLRMPNSG